jgi:hypothetical protein
MPEHIAAQLPFPVTEAVKQRLALVLSELTVVNRVYLAPDAHFGRALSQSGLLDQVAVEGIIDADPAKRGLRSGGLVICGYGDIELDETSVILITSIPHHAEIDASLRREPRTQRARIVDLIAAFDVRRCRDEIANAISRVMGIAADLAPREAGRENALDFRVPSGWGFGDKLCALHAARVWARSHPNDRVSFPTLPTVVSAYDDELVNPTAAGPIVAESSECFRRDSRWSVAANYLGCYLLGRGMSFDEPPTLELPRVTALPDLRPGSYAVLQPRAGWARPNIDAEELSKVVADSPLPVLLVGSPDTLDVQGALRIALGDELMMLRAVRHAAFAIGPRSAVAHIAAAYGVPAVIWVPSDGENWHLDYPGWDHIRVDAEDGERLTLIRSAVREIANGPRRRVAREALNEAC